MSTTIAGQLGADPTLPDVSIILGGVERKLCFDYNAIALVEKQTGLNLLKASVSQPSMTTVRALLWAALLRESPKLTLDEVSELIRPRNMAAIHYALDQVWYGSVVDPDAKAAPAGETPAQATPAA